MSPPSRISVAGTGGFVAWDSERGGRTGRDDREKRESNR